MSQTELTSRQVQIVAILDAYFECNPQKKRASIFNLWLSTNDEASNDLDAFHEELFDLFGTNSKICRGYKAVEVEWWNGDHQYQIEKVVEA